MKLITLLTVIAVALVFIPTHSEASTIFETTGWIIDKQGLVYDFEADTSPFSYKAIITDLSISPTFDLTDIFLAISTSVDMIDYRFGEGSITFPVQQGHKYFANVFAQGAGHMGAGNFGLIIQTVPLPTTLILIGSGLIGLVGLRKKLQN